MKYELSLMENAVDSLREALEKYDKALNGDHTSYKYIILHFSHFCELILKYYISKQHPLIIYKGAFSENFNPEKSNTIGLWETVNFIINEEKLNGKKIMHNMIDDLKTFKYLRNIIEHFHFKIDLSPFRKLFGRLIRMINQFNKEHKIFKYDEWIKAGLISTEQKKVLDDLVDEYQSKLNEAHLTVKEEENEACRGRRLKERDGIFPIYMCSECEHETFIKNSSSESGYKCTFCDSEISEYQEINCGICGLPWPRSDLEFSENFTDEGENVYICPRCMDPDY